MDFFRRSSNKKSYRIVKASKCHNVTEVKEMTNSGLDIHENDNLNNNLLMNACMNNNFDLIDWLLDEKIDVNHENDDGNTALIILADCPKYNYKSERHDAIVRLLSMGAFINKTNKKGQSVESLAIYHDNVYLLELVEKHNTRKKVDKNISKE